MEKLLYFVLGIFIMYLVYRVMNDKIHNVGDLSLLEGFSQTGKVEVFNNTNLYDTFYADVYSMLFDNTDKNMFELEKIILHTKMNEHSNVLDVGSGIGFHVNYLNKKGIPSVGMELSKDMISKSNKLYPDNKFKYGDILNILDIDLIQREDKFTHVLMLYFTIYYIENKRLLFENCYNSLKKGGHMAIHMVDKYNFDPLLDASNPLLLVDVQKVAKKRITDSVVKFKNFSYNASFSVENNNISKFTETFINKSGNKRINKHTLFMNTQKQILSIAKGVGFKLKAQINLSGVKYNNQYIYILYKA